MALEEHTHYKKGIKTRRVIFTKNGITDRRSYFCTILISIYTQSNYRFTCNQKVGLKLFVEKKPYIFNFLGFSLEKRGLANLQFGTFRYKIRHSC